MPRLSNGTINVRAIDENAKAVAGAKLYTYNAGTTTPITTYSDADLTTAHDFPVVANSAGAFDPIYVPTGAYKIDIRDPETDASLPGFPEDNVEPSEGSYPVRNLSSLQAAASLADDTIVTIGGLPYHVHSKYTGAMSVAWGDGVAGLNYVGQAYSGHFGWELAEHDDYTTDHTAQFQALEAYLLAHKVRDPFAMLHLKIVDNDAVFVNLHGFVHLWVADMHIDASAAQLRLMTADAEISVYKTGSFKSFAYYDFSRVSTRSAACIRIGGEGVFNVVNSYHFHGTYKTSRHLTYDTDTEEYCPGARITETDTRFKDSNGDFTDEYDQITGCLIDHENGAPVGMHFIHLDRPSPDSEGGYSNANEGRIGKSYENRYGFFSAGVSYVDDPNIDTSNQYYRTDAPTNSDKYTTGAIVVTNDADSWTIHTSAQKDTDSVVTMLNLVCGRMIGWKIYSNFLFDNQSENPDIKFFLALLGSRGTEFHGIGREHVAGDVGGSSQRPNKFLGIGPGDNLSGVERPNFSAFSGYDGANANSLWNAPDFFDVWGENVVSGTRSHTNSSDLAKAFSPTGSYSAPANATESLVIVDLGASVSASADFSRIPGLEVILSDTEAATSRGADSIEMEFYADGVDAGYGYDGTGTGTAAWNDAAVDPLKTYGPVSGSVLSLGDNITDIVNARYMVVRVKAPSTMPIKILGIGLKWENSPEVFLNLRDALVKTDLSSATLAQVIDHLEDLKLCNQ